MIEGIKKMVRSSRLNITLSSVLCLVLGGICLLSPGTVTDTVVGAMGFILLLVGVFMMVGQLLTTGLHFSGMALSGIVIVTGIFLCMKPGAAMSVVIMAFGIVLVSNGVEDFYLSYSIRSASGAHWYSGILFGIIDIVFGLLCIAGGFRLITFATRLAGAMLIYNAVTSIFLVHRANRADQGVVDGKLVRERDA